MRLPHPTTTLAAATVAIAALVAAPLTSPASASDDHSRSNHHHIAFSTDLAGIPSEQSLHIARVHSAGAPGTLKYGTTRVTGTAVIDSAPYDIEMVAKLQYLDNNGPYSGFFTFTSGINTLALTYNGNALQAADGSASYVGVLQVISGTGIYANTKGNGTVLAFRPAGQPVGGAVHENLTLDLVAGSPPLPVANPTPKVGRATAALDCDLAAVPAQQHYHAVTTTARTYGAGRLTCDSTFDGEPVSVEVEGLANYYKGQGPASGFITIFAADGSMISMAYSGNTVTQPANSTLTLGLKVIAASGKWLGTEGRGAATATRVGAVGTPLHLAMTTALHD
ncbi:MAG: hypothetical protein WCI29_13400 [Actinomycetes bacterium]